MHLPVYNPFHDLQLVPTYVAPSQATKRQADKDKLARIKCESEPIRALAAMDMWWSRTQPQHQFSAERIAAERRSIQNIGNNYRQPGFRATYQDLGYIHGVTGVSAIVLEYIEAALELEYIEAALQAPEPVGFMQKLKERFGFR